MRRRQPEERNAHNVISALALTGISLFIVIIAIKPKTPQDILIVAALLPIMVVAVMFSIELTMNIIKALFKVAVVGLRDAYEQANQGRVIVKDDGKGHTIVGYVFDENAWPKPVPESHQDTKSVEWSLNLIRELEWKRFEELCAEFFKTKGYTARLSGSGADGGIDIYVQKRGQNSVTAIVQCKAWKSQQVGVKEIRELFGVMTAEKVPMGIFMTSNTYTEQAQEFARQKHLKLINGSDLLDLIQKLSKPAQAEMLRYVTRGDYTTPTCPHCEVKMVLRHSHKNPGQSFWGCQNYPRCKQMIRRGRYG